ncbi:MAG TPA: hypothetical protein VF773_12945 [Verrucomicrobiae bacterium]
MSALFRLRALCVIAAAGYSAGAAVLVMKRGMRVEFIPVAVMFGLCLVSLGGIWFLSRPARWFFPLALVIQGGFTAVGYQVGVPQAVPVEAVGFVAAVVLQLLLLLPSAKKLFLPPPERDADAPVL